jgi:hypothetical protein
MSIGMDSTDPTETRLRRIARPAFVLVDELSAWADTEQSQRGWSDRRG